MGERCVGTNTTTTEGGIRFGELVGVKLGRVLEKGVLD
jgi:hypothetical protein